MKKLRIASLITAAVIPLTLVSCTLRDLNEEPDFSFGKLFGSSGDNESVTLDEANDHIRRMLSDVKLPDNEAAVKEDIEVLIRDLDSASDAAAQAQLKWHCKWNNSRLESEYDELDKTQYIMYDALSYAFTRAYDSDYSELFEELADKDNEEFFTSRSLSLERLEGYAEVDYRLKDEYTDRYFDVAYDRSLNAEEKDLKAAEVYLDIVTQYDPESFYERYRRDYSPEEILPVSAAVRRELIPVYEKLTEAFRDEKHSDDVFDHPIQVRDPFTIVRRYAERLSPAISSSAEKLCSEELYTIGRGTNCYTGSYTMQLYGSDTPQIYLYSGGTYFDVASAIHEFGHFYASGYEHTSCYESVLDLDTAEVQSQAMELLFMQFYDEIYQKQSDAMKLLTVSDMVDAVIIGFLVGEFEYKAVKQAEELTPKQVVELYNEILGDYAESYPFYHINHMFEYPGYYISYGVSALASLDILNDAVNAPEKALEKYEKIAAVSTSSKSCSFTAALKDCGFSDVLSEEYIKELAAELKNFIAEK